MKQKLHKNPINGKYLSKLRGPPEIKQSVGSYKRSYAYTILELDFNQDVADEIINDIEARKKYAESVQGEMADILRMDRELIDIQPMDQGICPFVAKIKLYCILNFLKTLGRSLGLYHPDEEKAADGEENEPCIQIREQITQIDIDTKLQVCEKGGKKWYAATVTNIGKSKNRIDDRIITVKYDNKGIKWLWDTEKLSLKNDGERIKIKDNCTVDITVKRSEKDGFRTIRTSVALTRTDDS